MVHALSYIEEQVAVLTGDGGVDGGGGSEEVLREVRGVRGGIAVGHLDPLICGKHSLLNLVKKSKTHEKENQKSNWILKQGVLGEARGMRGGVAVGHLDLRGGEMQARESIAA